MIGILLAYVVIQCIKYSLDLLNMRYLKAQGKVVPSEYLGVVDEELLKKTQQYTLETEKFSLVASLFSSILVVVFMFGGVLNWYNSMILSLHLPFIAAGWLFLILLYVANEIVSIPFSLYHTFKIENRYGFNTSTPRLWLSDLIKSLAVSLIMLSIVAAAALGLVIISPHYWWLWVWVFVLLFSLFVIYISPYVIDPLFNRFTSLEDDVLLEKIHHLVEQAGIRISKVLKMDQSKRSRHSNAYFSGIGKTKRIVLFDTLLESMDHAQIAAVLAHEIGHWKKRHVLKSLIIMQMISLLTLYTGFHLIRSGVLTALFNVQEPTFFANALIAVFLGSMAFFFLIPVANLFSRHFERQSDRYACALTGNGDALITALVKLSKDNLSNLFPHPLYAAVYYSHPPVLRRAKEIREYCEKKKV